MLDEDSPNKLLAWVNLYPCYHSKTSTVNVDENYWISKLQNQQQQQQNWRGNTGEHSVNIMEGEEKRPWKPGEGEGQKSYQCWDMNV